jgi:hypothetical protein
MVYIVRTLWSGASGGPGITNMAFENDVEGNFMDTTTAQTLVNAVRTFFNAQASALPNDITLSVSNNIDSYSNDTGNLGPTITAATAPATITGEGAGSFAPASGYKINLLTSSVIRNRRVRGRVFIVPAIGTAFDTSGLITSTIRGNATTAGAALLTAVDALNMDWVVWSRPVKQGETVIREGEVSKVTGVTVNAKSSVLRGRRD